MKWGGYHPVEMTWQRWVFVFVCIAGATGLFALIAH